MAAHQNRLADETSPYLLQHAHNPVDWYPWGDEVFARAKAEGKPIFLSVGYSACHWCHVMERESFENEQTAKLLNANFLSVKVDREERPDVDQIYMAAVQAMTGHGGWPMSVFLTPEGKPFYGGTYFPPADRHGMPGFPRVLHSVAQAWENRQEEIIAAADGMTNQLQTLGQLRVDPGPLDESLLDNAFRKLSRSFDPQHGGFGDAPKFPHPMDLRVLMRHHHRTGDTHALHMVQLTLDKMARGGIYDHLGGGFARYSTDDHWLVPHFEKMLYDNALLASTYIEAYQITRDPLYRQVVLDTLDYVLDRLTAPEGGFYSTEDADSEGVEGKYYVWTLDEIKTLLGDEKAETFARVYDVSPQGNWEHANILNLPHAISEAAATLGRDEDDLQQELQKSRRLLLEARNQRIPPAKDTKVLTSWNGLMIASMAEAGYALDNRTYHEAAEKAALYLLSHHRLEDGRLLHASKDGRARFPAYLEDYAYLIDGLTRLFEATGHPLWIESALDLTDLMLADFLDEDSGGFFFTAKDHEALIVRPKEPTDNATPSGNAMAVTALLRLSALTGRSDLEDTARLALESVRGLMEQAPTAAGQSLVALDFLLAPVREFAVIRGAKSLQEFHAVMTQIARRFLPHKVLAPSPVPVSPDLAKRVPLLASRPSIDHRATVYICHNFTCQAPVVGVEGLTEALDHPS